MRVRGAENTLLLARTTDCFRPLQNTLLLYFYFVPRRNKMKIVLGCSGPSVPIYRDIAEEVGSRIFAAATFNIFMILTKTLNCHPKFRLFNAWSRY